MSSTLPILPVEFDGGVGLELCPSTSLIEGPCIPLCVWWPELGDNCWGDGGGVAAPAIPETGMALSPRRNPEAIMKFYS
jgi:hypothetical protein